MLTWLFRLRIYYYDRIQMMTLCDFIELEIRDLVQRVSSDYNSIFKQTKSTKKSEQYNFEKYLW